MATPHDDDVVSEEELAFAIVHDLNEQIGRLESENRATRAALKSVPVELAREHASALKDAYARGRREAIEEAAQAAESCSGGDHETPARVVIAAKIRRLLGAVKP
jgi:hypothetical protein